GGRALPGSEQLLGRGHARLEGVARLHHPRLRHLDPAPLQRPDEALGPLHRRAVGRRAGDHRDVAVAQGLQVVGHLGRAVAVVGDHRTLGRVQAHRGHARVAAAHFLQHVGQRLVLRDPRHQHHSVQLLLQDEAAHARHVVRAAAVTGMHHQLEAGVAQRVERAVLEVDDVLGGRVVVDHADQERTPERQPARQRVGHVAHLAHQRLDLLARVRTHQRRAVDDPRHGLLGHPRQARDVVDRGSPARDPVPGRLFPAVAWHDLPPIPSRYRRGQSIAAANGAAAPTRRHDARDTGTVARPGRHPGRAGPIMDPGNIERPARPPATAHRTRGRRPRRGHRGRRQPDATIEEARMSSRIACFGELLLRLGAPGRELLLQSPRLEAWIGGAEANVGVSLARFGHEVAMLGTVADNALGRAALGELRRHGVDTGGVRLAPGRMGLYFLATGAGHRPSEVLYDRAGSAFATADAGAYDWPRLLHGAAWLHLSGITPALGPASARAAAQAVRAAVDHGVRVSFDGNFRPMLWAAWDGDPATMLRPLLEGAEIAFADQRDVDVVLGPDPGAGDDEPREHRFARAARRAFDAFPRLRRIACTARRQASVGHHALGALMATRDGELHRVEERPVPGIVDRIGGGDAFAAGVLHGLLSGWD